MSYPLITGSSKSFRNFATGLTQFPVIVCNSETLEIPSLPSKSLTTRPVFHISGGSLFSAIKTKSPISERLGDLIFVEKSIFRAFYHDLEEEGHSFVTHISGRKLWMFCALSSLGQELDRAARVRRTALSGTIRLLDTLKPTRAAQIFWTIVEPGCTIYFPYGFLHSVWTEVEQANCSCI